MGQGADDIRIGTAGWSVPSIHAATFPAEGSHLERYAARLNAVEINSSFHGPHRRATYERWAAATPDGFRFSAKLPKLATHDQRLLEPEAVLDRFAGEVAGLGDKLAVLLVQTPPSRTFDPDVVGPFIDAVEDRMALPVAWEPRHSSWFTPEADDWLAERRIARVAADPAKPAGAGEPGGWRGLTYIRLHGSPRMYYSAYAPERLKAEAEMVAAEALDRPVWCILDNTAGSAALGDALTVMDAVGQDRR